MYKQKKANPMPGPAPKACRQAVAEAVSDAKLADESEMEVIQILKRRARGINLTLDEDEQYKLSPADLSALTKFRDFTRVRADRKAEEAKKVSDIPDDPRYAQLGYALSCGHLPLSWQLMRDISNERGLSFPKTKKFSREELDKDYPGLPGDLKDASDAANTVRAVVDGMATYSLIDELPDWDVNGRNGQGELGSPDDETGEFAPEVDDSS